MSRSVEKFNPNREKKMREAFGLAFVCVCVRERAKSVMMNTRGSQLELW